VARKRGGAPVAASARSAGRRSGRLLGGVIPALLLALAACGSSRSDTARREPETPDEAICRQEARNSPAVRETWREWNPRNEMNMQRVGEERRIAEIRAFRDCMVRRGAALPGGVEPQRRL
jgi:hypothetical protein